MTEDVKRAYTAWITQLSPLFRIVHATVAAVLVELSFEADWKACER